MRNADYWRGRFSILEDSAHREAQKTIQDMEELYLDAQRSVQKEIESWYARFAVNNQISLTDARKWLTAGQLEEFHWSVEQYIKIGEQAGLDAAWLKKLENASARFHISRLEAVQTGIQQQLELLYGNQVDSLDALLKKVVGNGYTHTAFEVQKGVGLGWDITGLDQKKLETLLSKPWTTDGRTFRDRCWLNKNDLVGSVSKSLTQGLLRGDSPAKITTAIQKQFGVHRYKAGRLVNTETTYFNAVATKECYEDLDVEMVEIIETLDSHTCSICGGLDGTVIPISQYEPGVTVPPFHPNCRGTTAPAIDPKYAGERAARNADGDVYYVPANMKYADWVQTFVNGGSKAGLTVTKAVDIMKLRETIKAKEQHFSDLKAEYASLEETNQRYYLSSSDFDDPNEKAEWRKWRKTVDINQVQARMSELRMKDLPLANADLAEARFQLLKAPGASGYTPVSTLKEAEAYCKSVLGINADFKGLSIESVNGWNQGLSDMQEVFPDLVRKRFNFVGESHQRNAIAKQIEFQRQLDWIKQNNVYNWTDAQCEEWAKKKANSFVRKYLSVGNEMASSWSPRPPFDPCRGICLNRGFYADFESASKSMIRQVEIKWHPDSCSTVKSVFDHEFGHQLDDWLGVGKQKNIQALFDSRTRDQIKDELSEYAWNNHNSNRYSEMIAEGWSEYCNNPNPRPMAMEIGETIERLYVEWAKTNF